jgi:hypothetical protein
MVEKVTGNGRNVIDLLSYQQGRKSIANRAPALSARWCRHCGAALYEDELEDDCSSAGINVETPALRDALRKFYTD